MKETKVFKVLGALAAVLLAIALFGQAIADDGADLRFTKTSGPEVPVGGGVSFQIQVANHGEEDFSQTIQLGDDLPLGVDWIITSQSGWDDCQISGTYLSCVDSFIGKPSIVGGQIVYNSSNVTISGISKKCGIYTNSALFYWMEDEVGRSASRWAQATVTCPTPTPVPATSTPVVVVVTATPTSTPVISEITPTPTAFFIPKPPNTGSTQVATQGSQTNLGYYAAALIVMGIGLSTAATVHRKVKRE